MLIREKHMHCHKIIHGGEPSDLWVIERYIGDKCYTYGYYYDLFVPKSNRPYVSSNFYIGTLDDYKEWCIQNAPEVKIEVVDVKQDFSYLAINHLKDE